MNMKFFKKISPRLKRKLTTEGYVPMEEEQGMRFSVIAEGKYNLAKTFICKTNVNTKDESGATALITVCRYCNGKTQHEAVAFINFLLQKGAHIEKFDKSGKTAILYAQENGLTNIQELLLKRKMIKNASWEICKLQTQLLPSINFSQQWI